MCSISINATVENQLRALERSGDRERIEKRLFREAAEADIGIPGTLDNLAYHMYGMPADLKYIRRKRFGRHRVFFTGHYNQCSYRAFYIKLHKKKGVNDELDPAFHKVLRRALAEAPMRILTGLSERPHNTLPDNE